MGDPSASRHRGGAIRRVVAVGRGVLAIGLLAGVTGLVGCSDPSTENGTQVEVDPVKQQEGFKKMQDYMQRKSKGEVPGIPKK